MIYRVEIFLRIITVDKKLARCRLSFFCELISGMGRTMNTMIATLYRLSEND